MHYLHVNEGHMVSGAMMTTTSKVGLKVGPASALIAPHTPSEETPTLKNKAFPVIDHHDLSQEMPEWAMRAYAQSRLRL